MPFRLLNKKYQDQLSISYRLAPFLIFLAGLGITFTLSIAFFESEKKINNNQVTSASWESFKIQNLTLMNSLLKLQSYSEVTEFQIGHSKGSRSAIRQILSSTDFTSIEVLNLTKTSSADPQALTLMKMNPGQTDFTSVPTSLPMAKKILHMSKSNIPHSLALNIEDGKLSINSIWRSQVRKNQFVVFSSPMELFLKDWPLQSNIAMSLRDKQSGLGLTVKRSAADKKVKILILQNEETAPKYFSLIYRNSLVSDYYGLESEWYQIEPIKPSNYVFLIAICGFIISLIVSLFARFLLHKNRDIYRLVVARTEELEKAMQLAKEGNQAKTRFLANMSHELRTPLNLILGMLEVMQGRSTDEKEKKYILSMQSAGRHLLNLITDLLMMSKDEVTEIPIKKSSFNSYNFFEDITAIVRPECKGKGLEIVLDHSAEIPPVITGDTVKTRQIILNLIRNSMKYTPKGQITLKTEIVKIVGEGNVRTCHLRLTVSDTGSGIPEEKMKEIFDGFYQLDRTNALVNGSIGLSLSIVRDLILKLNGNISVKSEVGKGTDFIVDLDFEVVTKDSLEIKAALDDNESTTEKALIEVQEVSDSQREVINVLVVDDDPGNRELLEAYLDEPRFKVKLAVNGLEAFELYKAERPDLVIADLRMPLMNGFELAEAINEHDQKNNFEVAIPYVLLTADALDETHEESKKYPISVFLTKPVRKRKMLEVINELMLRKRLVAARPTRIQQAV